MIFPGKTIGVFGGGQLGRMLGYVARRCGYGFCVYDAMADVPANAIADRFWSKPYTDETSLKEFAASCDVITYEFENVAVAAIDFLIKEGFRVFPGRDALYLTQQRFREKTFIQSLGLPVAPFAEVVDAESFASAIKKIGLPAVLKTAQGGYDGKGQRTLRSEEDVTRAAEWIASTKQTMVLEGWVEFSHEVSVVAARNEAGQFVAYPVIENEHRDHILFRSRCPANVPEIAATRAITYARAIADGLKYVGTLGVEFFVTSTGEVIVNEIAPRPHNSGHLTIEGAHVSQFEQQLRAICGLPLGSAELNMDAVTMINLVAPADDVVLMGLDEALSAPKSASIHLYGKRGAKKGRKMGHLTAMASTRAEADQLATAGFEKLRWVGQ